MSILSRICTPTLCVGVVFALLLGAFTVPSGNLLGVDGFYHAAQGKAYFDDRTIPYPTLTYFTEYPADPWLLYHLLIGTVDKLLSGEGGDHLVFATNITHGLLTFLCIWILLVLVTENLERVRLNRTNIPRESIDKYKWPLVTVIGLFIVFVFDQFGFRVFILQRPHTLMVLLTLLVTWAFMKRRNHAIFGFSALAPLSYSIPLFVFLPHVAFVLGWLIVGKKLNELRYLVAPLFFTSAGITFGVLLHPQTVGYLVNGIGFHSFAILQSMLPTFFDISLTAIPDEMRGIVSETNFGFPSMSFLLATGILATALWPRTLKQTLINSRSQRTNILEHGLVMLALLLLTASLFIFRIIEYAYVFALIAATPILLFDLLPKINASLVRFGKTVGVQSHKIRGVSFQKIFQLTLAGSVIGIILTASLQSGNRYLEAIDSRAIEYQRYAGAFNYLATESTTGLILLRRHDMYAYITFFESTGCATGTFCVENIATGMDARMAYFYDSHFAEKRAAFFGQALPNEANQSLGYDAAMSFLQEYDVEFIIEDRAQWHHAYERSLSEYKFLQEVFQDEKYPAVKIYTFK